MILAQQLAIRIALFSVVGLCQNKVMPTVLAGNTVPCSWSLRKPSSFHAVRGHPWFFRGTQDLRSPHLLGLSEWSSKWQSVYLGSTKSRKAKCTPLIDNSNWLPVCYCTFVKLDVIKMQTISLWDKTQVRSRVQNHFCTAHKIIVWDPKMLSNSVISLCKIPEISLTVYLCVLQLFCSTSYCHTISSSSIFWHHASVCVRLNSTSSTLQYLHIRNPENLVCLQL